MLLLLISAIASSTGTAAEPESAPAVTELPVAMRAASPVLTEAVRQALTARDWPAAISALESLDRGSLDEAAKADQAFLIAWSHVHRGTAEQAEAQLSRFSGTDRVPASYVDLVIGEVELAGGDAVAALASLSKVPADSPIYPRGAVLRAETLKKLSRRSEANEVFETIASRPDPAPGNALALLALGQHKGGGSPEAYPYLRRLWTHYPTSPEAKTGAKLLAAYGGKAPYVPTSEEWSLRAEAWMKAGAWDNALKAGSNALPAKSDDSSAACRVLFVRGRSAYKKNHLTPAIDNFANAGERCVNAEGAYGPRSLYVQGTALFRKKRYKESAAVFVKIPALYPAHSMADDGYTHAGISLQESGDLAGAQVQWRKALEQFPDGDTAAEATWRLAWSLYLDGKTDEARDIAKALGQLSYAVDAVHVDAGRYWYARWALYPDVKAPTVSNEAGRAEAIAGWDHLLLERPFSFYAILAASRLAEEAPEVLAKRQQRGERGALERSWRIRDDVLQHPRIAAGAQLAKLGLSSSAQAEWAGFDGELSADETAWLMELRIGSGDWLLTHQDFRRWIKKHPVGSLGEGERAIVRVAYPDRYWTEVQAASKPYERFEARLFHSLVREESNFNRKIISFAGARGLSQLMPATATQTAGWLGKKITMADLFIPDTNLEIGGRYLEAVVKQLNGSPYCALAGYNAGPNRVKQWHGQWDGPPTDEFVERIPFRETRGYVKRVMGTWQTYRWFVDDGEPFADLSDYNHAMFGKP